MTITVKIEGMAQLQRNLQKFADDLGKKGGALDDSLQRSAERIRDRARAIVPVKTGNLRDSIEVKRDATSESGYTVEVDLEQAPYGVDVEFGNSYMEAQPFMRPAFDEAERQETDEIADELRREIERPRI
mgnify:FL=1